MILPVLAFGRKVMISNEMDIVKIEALQGLKLTVAHYPETSRFL